MRKPPKYKIYQNKLGLFKIHVLLTNGTAVTYIDVDDEPGYKTIQEAMDLVKNRLAEEFYEKNKREVAQYVWSSSEDEEIDEIEYLHQFRFID